jgi:hypothetical protein
MAGASWHAAACNSSVGSLQLLALRAAYRIETRGAGGRGRDARGCYWSVTRRGLASSISKNARARGRISWKHWAPRGTRDGRGGHRQRPCPGARPAAAPSVRACRWRVARDTRHAAHNNKCAGCAECGQKSAARAACGRGLPGREASAATGICCARRRRRRATSGGADGGGGRGRW